MYPSYLSLKITNILPDFSVVADSVWQRLCPKNIVGPVEIFLVEPPMSEKASMSDLDLNFDFLWFLELLHGLSLRRRKQRLSVYLRVCGVCGGNSRGWLGRYNLPIPVAGNQ